MYERYYERVLSEQDTPVGLSARSSAR
jgi:hypothetical protein